MEPPLAFSLRGFSSRRPKRDAARRRMSVQVGRVNYAIIQRVSYVIAALVANTRIATAAARRKAPEGAGRNDDQGRGRDGPGIDKHKRSSALRHAND